MSDRRMFAKSIVLSDAFMDMPTSARCLYFTFGMLADDDGFVNNPKSITRQCGASADDLSVLVAKKFLIAFESGVVVIKHWKIHNLIKSDRYKPTTYTEEKEQLFIEANKAYTLDGTKVEPKWNQSGTKVEPQSSLGQVRLGKDSIGKVIIESLSDETPTSIGMMLSEEELGQLFERVDNVSELIDIIDSSADLRSIKNPYAYALAVARKEWLLK